MKLILLGAVLLSMIASARAAAPAMNIPDDFPRFIVPGHQQEMDSLRCTSRHFSVAPKSRGY